MVTEVIIIVLHPKKMACPDFGPIVDNCSGAIGTGNALTAYWQTVDCPAAYAQAINTGPNSDLTYNPDNQVCIQDKIVELFDNYLSTNNLTDNVTNPRASGYSTFQNTLLSLCTNPTLPGICDKFLGGTPTDPAGPTGYCTGFTREDAINSATIRNFCGCYVPPDPQYLQYTLGSPECLIGAPGCTAGCEAGTPGCTGQPACDPLCHRALTAPKAYIPTGDIIGCPQTICVIDNVVINAINTEIQEGINFNTICSGCVGPSGGDGCLCIVSGTNISATMAQIGIGTNFNFFCGTGSVCLVEDTGGTTATPVPCENISSSNIPVNPRDYLPNLGVVIIIMLFVVLVLFLLIAVRYASPNPIVPTTLTELPAPQKDVQLIHQIP